MTLETVGEAMPSVLEHVERHGPISSGNLTRKLMGAGLLPNQPTSYALVKVALTKLAIDGKVSKAGNGKSVHWRSAGVVLP